MTAAELEAKEVFTAEEAARYLSIGRTSMYALLRDKAVKSITIGRSRRIRRRDLDAYLDQLAEEQE